MSDMVAQIAHEARRAALLRAVRRMRRVSLGDLSRVIQEGGANAEALGSITIGELRGPAPPAPSRPSRTPWGEPAKDAMLRTFRGKPTHAFACDYFVQLVALPQRIVTTLLNQLIEAGHIEHLIAAGRLRYRLVTDESSAESCERTPAAGVDG